MARRYLNLGRDEWDALSWDVRRAYLDGMAKDESVPLTFEEHGGEDEPAGIPGMPADVPGIPAPATRRADPAAVIDISGMIGDLEAARTGGGDR